MQRFRFHMAKSILVLRIVNYWSIISFFWGGGGAIRNRLIATIKRLVSNATFLILLQLAIKVWGEWRCPLGAMIGAAYMNIGTFNARSKIEVS